VFGGAVIGLAALVLAGSLWLALAYSSHVRTFYVHLDWWLGGSAIAATFLAGLLAGGVSGTRGPAAGLANGVTTWALLTIATLGVGLGAAATAGTVHSITVGGRAISVTTVRYWTSFWAVLIGLGAGGLGGLLGGMIPRRRSMRWAQVVDVRTPEADESVTRTRSSA
jgi:hypothetical protein